VYNLLIINRNSSHQNFDLILVRREEEGGRGKRKEEGKEGGRKEEGRREGRGEGKEAITRAATKATVLASKNRIIRGKEEGGRRKEEGGRREEEGGRRKEGGGRRKKGGGKGRKLLPALLPRQRCWPRKNRITFLKCRSGVSGNFQK
jgi:hypothetical protein